MRTALEAIQVLLLLLCSSVQVVTTGNRAISGADGVLAMQCVQERQTCSVGSRPTGVKVRSPLAWVASAEKTKLMKPTDKAICRDGE